MGVSGAPVVRRAPVTLALVLVVTLVPLLVLLLEVHLPPPAPTRRPPPVPQFQAASAHPANRTATSTHNTTAYQSSAADAQPPDTPARIRDLYVPGHTRPHPELCPALGERVRLVILVTSAPSHASARAAVRLTWGHAAQRTDIALGFMLGASPSQFRAALDREDALYGDLIEGRFVDSYSNLTLKTLSMLEWVNTYCPRAPRLLKTDDDMFINVHRLLRFAEAPGRVNATNTVWGKVVRRGRPARAPGSKYYVPRAEFSGRVYPDFATGPAYLLTADAVRLLLRAAPSARYLRLEDVFVTGVLAEHLGIRRVHARVFYNVKVALRPCAVQRGVALHMVRYHEQFDLWRKLLDPRFKCQPFKPSWDQHVEPSLDESFEQLRLHSSEMGSYAAKRFARFDISI